VRLRPYLPLERRLWRGHAPFEQSFGVESDDARNARPGALSVEHLIQFTDRAMPRIVEITVPAAQTGKLLARIQNLPGLVGLRVQKGISVQPPGDVVAVTVSNSLLPDLLHTLDEMGITDSQGTSVSTSRPLSVISPIAAQTVRNDTSYTLWEEVDQELNKESDMSLGTMVVMAIAGAIAATGMLTNVLHLVIGAMVMAPGFEPIARFSLGVINRRPAWKSGARDTLKGYAALIAGAILTALTLQPLGYSPATTGKTYLPEGALLSYWTSISPIALLGSVAAAVAGAILILQERSVLTAGVMIALALIPAAVMFGIGVANAHMQLVTAGLTRLAIEMLLVATTSLAVFACKFKWIEKRRMTA
jgi:hypothetical protein